MFNISTKNYTKLTEFFFDKGVDKKEEIMCYYR